MLGHKHFFNYISLKTYQFKNLKKHTGTGTDSVYDSQ